MQSGIFNHGGVGLICSWKENSQYCTVFPLFIIGPCLNGGDSLAYGWLLTRLYLYCDDSCCFQQCLFDSAFCCGLNLKCKFHKFRHIYSFFLLNSLSVTGWRFLMTDIPDPGESFLSYLNFSSLLFNAMMMQVLIKNGHSAETFSLSVTADISPTPRT